MRLLAPTHFAPSPYTHPTRLACQSYLPGGSFQIHWDSRYHWGEFVAGVTLGASCVIRFVKQPHGPTVNVLLPRRSVYVMTGESRVAWKHGIFYTGREDTARPSWNPDGCRRSYTLRATKTFSMVRACPVASEPTRVHCSRPYHTRIHPALICRTGVLDAAAESVHRELRPPSP